ncbi:Proteasome activator BLM10 [Coemansia sp. Benny D115]|nr:Proteasome activator BLM10 [Coemansia sp. Benny D115]
MSLPSARKMKLDEVNWAEYLPYSVEAESATFERDLIAQLKLYTLSNNLPAISALLSQLDSNYNAISLPNRIHICRILYDLVTSQPFSFAAFGLCCSILSRALRRESQLTIDDLTLDWRKLYNLIKGLALPKQWHDNLIQNRSRLKSVVELICVAGRFFPPEAAKDVFEELLPQIQFNSMDWQLLVVQMLNLFVPASRSPSRALSPGSQTEGEAFGPEKWLPTIFSLWTFNLRTSGYDSYFMNLVTCITIEHKGCYRFTNEQMRFAFASGLHFFNLPVMRSSASLPRGTGMSLADTSNFYRLPLGGALPLSEERAHTFARFIVYTMNNEGSGGSLELFEQLVQMIEPFYHPSNNGSWSGILSRFLRHLGKELMQRVRHESSPECKTPESLRLTRQMRRRFVVSARTLAMLLLFSKSEDSVSMSHSTLKHLAEVEPDLIFEPLLETLYAAIDSVTETHRMISAMRALAKLASTLSNYKLYPEGAQHVAPLLILTLPGIDVNDQLKTWFALTFVFNLCLNGVVFRELPCNGDMPLSPSKDDSDVSMHGEDTLIDTVPEPDMAQVEWMTRASTAQFETWIDQFLRRVFALVDNMSSSLDTSSPLASTLSSADFGLQAMMAYTLEAVLMQCSDRYYPMISRLVTNFVTSISSLSAVDGMCRVVRSYVNALPEQALSKLLPICFERIAEEVKNGVGAQPSMSKFTQSHSDTTLIWYAAMLSVLVEGNSGEPLVDYVDQIHETIDLLLSRCLSRHIYTIASEILNNTIDTLTRMYVMNERSVSAELWQDPEFQENHFRHWGEHAKIDENFSLQWHVPSQPEIDAAMKLVRSIIVPRISALNELLDRRTRESSTPNGNEENVRMHRLLFTMCYGIRCLGMLVAPPGSPIEPDELADVIVEGNDASGMPPRYLLDRQVQAGYIFAEGTAEYAEITGIREDIGKAAARALAYMAESGEDGVENIKAALKLAQHLICHFGVDQSLYSSYRRAWNYGLDNFSLDNNDCVIPRFFASNRMAFMHVSRLLHNTRFCKPTPLSEDIARWLAHFCLSQYAEVRRYAVSALESVVSVIPALKYPLIPRFLAELSASESSDPERMTGALRVLDTPPMRRAFLRDWKYFPDLVLALCRAQHEDKPQVKKLVRSTAVSQMLHVAAPRPISEVSAEIRRMVEELPGPAADEAAIARMKAKCQQIYEFSSAEHAQLVDALVDILRDAGTTWRFAAIAGYYLDQLSSVTIPVPPRVAATLAENLTSDLVLFRESAAHNLAQILSRLKYRSKPEESLRLYQKPDPSADYSTLCERALAGDEDALEAPFLDSPAAGWFVWPQQTKVYSPPSKDDQEMFAHIDSGSQAAYDAVRDIMFADGKWTQIARLFSLESTRSPDEDTFGVSRATLHAQLFSLFGLPLLELAWPSIKQLAEDHERLGAQRAAAEIISGVIRGSKHWSRNALARMWELLTPLLTSVFSRIRQDTLRYWQVGLQYIFARRDPRRFLPLIRLLLYTNAFDPQSEAPFAEATKLELIRLLLCCCDWRVASAVVSSKPRLLDALAHPYKQVRDAAGITMYMLSSSEFSVSYGCVKKAISDLASYGSTGRDFSHWSGTPRTQELVKEMAARVNMWRADHIPSNEGTSDYSRGSKTLLTFFVAGFGFSSRRLAIAHIPSILPLFSVLQEQHDDEDVSKLANVIMQFFSLILYTAQLSEDVANRILALLDDSTAMWHVVTKTLPLLCTLTFANRFTLSREVRALIMDTTASFLEHDQLEVRQAASTSLTSLIKCASNTVIADINSKFSKKLATRLPHVRHGKPLKNPVSYGKTVLTRHAGVLGLSCLVLAFPYTIPDWLPEVLVVLANCIDDPNPIQSTVQHTFAEFRRTHMDTWHEDRKKFTSSQLEILTDMLVSPCYYA